MMLAGPAPNPFIQLAPDQNPADPCAGCPEYYSADRACCTATPTDDPSPSRRERRAVAADPPAREHLRGHGAPGGLF